MAVEQVGDVGEKLQMRHRHHMHIQVDQRIARSHHARIANERMTQCRTGGHADHW
jgi:hypothetical protein